MKKKFICIVCFFCMLAACTCPTGMYVDPGYTLWEFLTEYGKVSGTIYCFPECGGNYDISGTSDGVNISLYVECENPQTECCSPIVFELTSNEECTLLTGTASYPPESNCYGNPTGPVKLVKEDAI